MHAGHAALVAQFEEGPDALAEHAPTVVEIALIAAQIGQVGKRAGNAPAVLQLAKSHQALLIKRTSGREITLTAGDITLVVEGPGDARLIEAFRLYRTYHGCAMSPPVQAASIAAWQDEAHVIDNRRLYREKIAAVAPLLAPHLRFTVPQAGFYFWAQVPEGHSDTAFARALYHHYHVTVLPGSYLAREAHGFNPGAGRVRMALVAETAECVEAAERIVQFIQSRN